MAGQQHEKFRTDLQAFLDREFAKRPHLTRPGPEPYDSSKVRAKIDYYRGRLEARRKAREMEDGDDESESESETDTDTEEEDEVKDDIARGKEEKDGLMAEGQARGAEEEHGEETESDEETWEDCEDKGDDEDVWVDCEDEVELDS